MHSEVVSNQPGSCPKCGMALEPDVLSVETKTIYTCPMHPEVQQDNLDNCPKCGMALEPMSVAALAVKDDSELGWGWSQEICRVRLQRCKQLLTETDFSMPAVARHSGFSSARHLATVFRREVG